MQQKYTYLSPQVFYLSCVYSMLLIQGAIISVPLPVQEEWFTYKPAFKKIDSDQSCNHLKVLPLSIPIKWILYFLIYLLEFLQASYLSVGFNIAIYVFIEIGCIVLKRLLLAILLGVLHCLTTALRGLVYILAICI